MKAVRALASISLLSLLIGCALEPLRLEALEAAREEVVRAEDTPAVARHAPVQLREAQELLYRAERAVREHDDRARVTELARQAEQQARAALLQARAEQAKLDAEQAGHDRAQARLAARDRELARLLRQTEAARARLAEAESELTGMRVQRTARGLELTLDEVQFGFDSDRLRPGSERSIDRLARYLEAYPDQQVQIEGHTDSVGASDYNQRLSERRAQTVRDELLRRGVDPAMVDARGLGEEVPVASNDTEAGRAENRRVEVIVSTERAPWRQQQLSKAAVQDQPES